jgi:hypothetical protein
MAGRSASNTITRYAGIQVQTSSLGVNIPVGWGTYRCKCNLVWYNNFKSTAQKAASGKGGSTTTGYSYSASLILGICEGPIDSIKTVYVDSKIYTNGVTTALAQAGLSLATGAIGQAVWSYLTSNYPSQAIGYSGLAIAYAANYALDSSASPPNHSFEVARTSSFAVGSSADADPSLVVTDFFTNGRYGVPSWASGLLGSLTQYQNYCLAAGLLVSPVIDAQRSASDFLTELLLATNSTCVWSEGLLKFIPYGDTALTGNGKTYAPNNTVIYSLDDDDFIPQSEGDAPLLVDIMDQSDAYNVVQLEFLDRTNQYNMAIALASDAANVAQYGMRRKDPDTVHMICDPNIAAIASQLWLQRTLYIRAQYKFKLGWMFAILEPGDILELTDAGLGLSAYPVRIIQIDEDEQYGLSITAEDFPIGVSSTPLYAMQTGGGLQVNQSTDPGGVEANLLLWSGDQTNGAYTKSLCTITGNVANDQYGLTTADALTTTASTGTHQVSQSFSAFAGLNYTFAVCIQKNAHKNARVFVNDGAGNGGYIEVDTNAGVILTPGTAQGTGVVVSASLNTTLVAGIWQVALTVQVPAATTLYAGVAALSDTGALSWTATAGNALNLSQWAVRQGLAPGVYAQTTSAIAGPLIFNPPAVLNTAGSSAWAAVAGGPNWGGAYVWVSVDGGTDYAQVGTIDAPARYGAATASYASGADPDTTDTLAVDLGASGGGLSSAADAAADNGATLCLLDNELVCFSIATLTNPSRYSLTTYIRRGYLNTPIAAHSAGAPFVRLDDAIFDLPYLAPNVGTVCYVKFQSFNQWGQGVTPLSDCVAYPFTPVPIGAAPPGASTWTATAVTLANMGQSVPAIQITGVTDNPSATGVIFYYRVTGSATWVSAGLHSIDTTLYNITSVASGQNYDVAVAYLVSGVVGTLYQIASALTVGSYSAGNTSITPGTVILSTSVSGAGNITLPAGSYGNAVITLTGADGGGEYAILHGEPSLTFKGGKGGTATKTITVTPGTTNIAYSLGLHGSDNPSSTPGTAGGNSTVTSPALTAHGGAGGGPSANGAGGNATGGDTNTTGATGGVTVIGGAKNGSITITALA